MTSSMIVLRIVLVCNYIRNYWANNVVIQLQRHQREDRDGDPGFSAPSSPDHPEAARTDARGAAEYDGGELLVEDTYGVQRVKLEAGSLDMAMVRLTKDHQGNPALVSLTGVYNNLLRMWGQP